MPEIQKKLEREIHIHQNPQKREHGGDDQDREFEKVTDEKKRDH